MRQPTQTSPVKVLLLAVRILVGVLFIFSGLIKANDPLGLSYKMQEFFEVWHLTAFGSFTTTLSILMIVFEILAGVALLLAWKMELFSYLLLLLIVFFTFLTGYAFLSGKVRECGCFGNCIPLDAGQSFLKDLILTVLIILLFVNRKKFKAWIPNPYNVIILFFAVVFSFSLQWYVLQHLPIVDCLPYKVGTTIEENMKPPPGSLPDSTVITFQYTKNGKEVEFTADKFPADFDDSYHFVKRYDKLIRKGNAEPAIKDFSLKTLSGGDTTLALLEKPGFTLFLFAKELPETNPTWNKEFAAIMSQVKLKNLTLFIITAQSRQAEAFLQANAITDHVQILQCDVTAIKTAARANPTLMLMKKGVIVEKWGYADFEEALPTLSTLPNQE